MTFELDASQRQIQSAVREFAKGEFDTDLILEWEKAGTFPRKIFKSAADLGFIGLHFDEAFSGGGMGIFETVLAAETLCQRDSSCGMALVLAGFGAELIADYGSTAQKENYLTALAQGDICCGAALFEGGYDFSRIQTRAEKQDGQWVIRGLKAQVSNALAPGAGEKAVFPVLCSTGEKALSFILVEAGAPGLSITPTPRRLGNNLSPAGELVLDSVRVPGENLLGKEGRGLAMAQAFLAQAQIIHAGLALGIAQGALDRALAYGKKRAQFGRKIASFEPLAHALGEMAMEIEGARGLVYRAARVFDAKKLKKQPALAPMAMEMACRVAEKTADTALQIHGGYGYMQEGEVEHFYRDAKFLKLYASNPQGRLGSMAATVIGKIR